MECVLAVCHEAVVALAVSRVALLGLGLYPRRDDLALLQLLRVAFGVVDAAYALEDHEAAEGVSRLGDLAVSAGLLAAVAALRREPVVRGDGATPREPLEVSHGGHEHWIGYTRLDSLERVNWLKKESRPQAA